MFSRFVAFGVLCALALNVFASDEIDRSTPSEKETFERLAKDLAPLQNVALATTLAPKIADYVVAHGKQTRFNVGTSTWDATYALRSYALRFYTEREIYVVTVNTFKTGGKSLYVDHYMTNQHFVEYVHPADPIAEQLIMGAPKIHIETHFYDDGASGIPHLVSQYVKKVGPVYDGFTREERDLGAKAGVTKYTLDRDQVNEGEGTGWQKATDEEIAEAREEYAHRLGVIAKKFSIVQ